MSDGIAVAANGGNLLFVGFWWIRKSEILFAVKSGDIIKSDMVIMMSDVGKQSGFFSGV